VRQLDLVLLKRLGLPAVMLVLLAVALIGQAEIWFQSHFPAVLGHHLAGVASIDRGFLIAERATIHWTTVVESQERRYSRKHAIDELREKPMALCDKDVRFRICQQPPCASWMTTLTTAAEPCTVLCVFLI